MTIWQTVPVNEIDGLQARADGNGGELQIDDALSVLREEMTDQVMADTRSFWEERGVSIRVDVDPEEDPAADLLEGESA